MPLAVAEFRLPIVEVIHVHTFEDVLYCCNNTEIFTHLYELPDTNSIIQY